MGEDSLMSQWYVKEIKIPLSRGYIAAREWGLSAGDHCLALHGWQDNAGSFDTLIPLLSPELHVIAIDILGHGLSTQKPVGAPYFFMEFIYHVKHVVEHLKWSKFIIIGHSMGSSIGFAFASLYPEMVAKLISIDLIKPVTHSVGRIPALLRLNLEVYKDAENKTVDTQPSYSEEDAMKRLIEGRDGAISECSAKILSKRGTRKLQNGRYVFSRDIRLRDIWSSGLNCFDTMVAIMSGIKCDLLIIKAKDSPLYSERKALQIFLDIYKKQCRRFELIEVEGNHFVHLEHPERIAPLINSFLKHKHSSL